MKDFCTTAITALMMLFILVAALWFQNWVVQTCFSHDKIMRIMCYVLMTGFGLVSVLRIVSFLLTGKVDV